MIYSLFCFHINILLKLIHCTILTLCCIYFPRKQFLGGYGKKNRRNMSVWFSDLSINHISIFLFLPFYLMKYAYSSHFLHSRPATGNPAFRIKYRIFKNCYSSFIYFTRRVHGWGREVQMHFFDQQKSICKSMLSPALFVYRIASGILQII